jgi:competence protein ComEA
MLPDWLNEYLRYTRGQRIGLYSLVLLVVCVVLVNIWHRVSFMERATADLIRFGPSMLVFEEQVAAQRAEYGQWEHKKEHDRFSAWRASAERFAFDPNTLDSAGWVRLGFSPKQSLSILRYRSKGATFKSAEDLLRLFMVDSALYLELRPYVTIEQSTQQTERAPLPERKFAALPMVDINLADTLELEELRGIGPAFARRIYRYRERLGGFISPEQLLEVYGMDSARYEGILPQVTLNVDTIRPLNVNSADYTGLIRHPYLNKNQVRAIIRYREQHGEYRSVDDLLRIHLIGEKDLERLRPYLTVRTD